MTDFENLKYKTLRADDASFFNRVYFTYIITVLITLVLSSDITYNYIVDNEYAHPIVWCMISIIATSIAIYPGLYLDALRTNNHCWQLHENVATASSAIAVVFLCNLLGATLMIGVVSYNFIVGEEIDYRLIFYPLGVAIQFAGVYRGYIKAFELKKEFDVANAFIEQARYSENAEEMFRYLATNNRFADSRMFGSVIYSPEENMFYPSFYVIKENKAYFYVRDNDLMD